MRKKKRLFQKFLCYVLVASMLVTLVPDSAVFVQADEEIITKETSETEEKTTEQTTAEETVTQKTTEETGTTKGTEKATVPSSEESSTFAENSSTGN
ncbi:MAG: hypothetical protein Q4B70_13360, partial [Lachnospiraceae bacterium]|nr:hypothetical protein [Lachnospiraceae bacterium]